MSELFRILSNKMDRKHAEPRIAITVRQILIVFYLFQTAVGRNTTKPKKELKIIFSMARQGFGEIVGPALLEPIETAGNNFNYDVDWKILDTNNSVFEITSAFFRTISDFNPHVIIGENDERCCDTLATLASASNTLYISIGCNPLEFLTDRGSYQTYASPKPGPQAMGVLLLKLMELFNWTRVGFITALNQFHPLRYRQMKLHLKNAGKQTFTYYHAKSSGTWADYTMRIKTPEFMIKNLAKQTQLFVVLMPLKEAEFILRHAEMLGYLNGSHAFIVPSLNERDGSEKLDIAKFEGVMSFDRIYPTNTSEWKGFMKKVRDGFDSDKWKDKAAGWNRAPAFDSDTLAIKRAMEYGALLNDAILVWLNVVSSAETSDQSFDEVARNGPTLANRFGDIHLEGISGSFTLPGGYRNANWSISMIQDGEPKTILFYNEERKTWTDMNPDLVWPGGSATPPIQPRCFKDECEKEKQKMLIIICCSLGAVVVCILIVGFIASLLWKRVQEKQIIANWKIIWSDVVLLGDSQNVNTNSSIDRRSITTTSAGGRYFISAGTYKGTTIAIKAVQRESVNIFERSIYKELKQMVYVKHDNINPFIGVCADHPNVCVAMAYAEKGSIQNVLADPQFDIDWEFRMSLAMDVAKGMEYLHSTPVATHGHLTSANCVIDERWVCKITDYGLRLFRCIDKLERPLSDQLWTAPEILRKKFSDDLRVYGTKPGDVYSFGIIISELLTRELPYQNGVGTITMEELLAKVKMSFEPPFRPYLPAMEGHIAAQWIGLANNCWQTVPDKRPTFKSIKSILLANHSGKFTNVLERMQMILEESIERANTDLMVERRKTETMLESILPRPVVESITSGTDFEPQLSDFVTLCLCDTVGFYKATNELPADVVVDVLKSMYQQYDEIVGKYQAFEISTSGSRDSMMLAGGLPVNPKVDAEAICTMALELLSFIQTFTHPRIESRDIQMKITIHTGPAYAAVMGKQIPQFCVFGEMVQTTTTLHTFGNAMLIRISNATRDQLSPNSGLKVEGAEVITLKDTTMIMYVVTGKEGFKKPLPSTKPTPARKKSSSSSVRQRSSAPKVPK